MVQTNTGPADRRTEAVKDEAVEHAHDLKDTAVEHAEAVTREATGKVIDVAHDVRRELESQGDTQARRLGGAVHDASRQLHDMADRAEPGQVGRMTRQLAGGAERLAGRLEAGGLQGVGDDLRGFARRQPGMFLFAAGVAGFVATRVLRNAGSSSDSSGPSSTTMSQPGPVVGSTSPPRPVGEISTAETPASPSLSETS
jgi:hypothetical protein